MQALMQLFNSSAVFYGFLLNPPDLSDFLGSWSAFPTGELFVNGIRDDQLSKLSLQEIERIDTG